VNEGAVFTQPGTITDADGDPLSATVDYGDGRGPEPLPLTGGEFVLSHVYGDNGLYTVTITASDGIEPVSYPVQVTVLNVAPTLEEIITTSEPVAVGTPVAFSADFCDPGFLDTHTGAWNFGDGTSEAGTVDEEDGCGTIYGEHVYTEAGIYIVEVYVEDDDGGDDWMDYLYVVVYDPSAGFVTGGGWIDSPEGAYTPDPTAAGRATFGFVSKYKKGATVPEGNTQFVLHSAGFNFHSNEYDWLVVAGSKAQFKGVGTINGLEGYGFMIVARDGTPDSIRVKIWEIGSEAVICDNQGGESLVSDATTALGGGSIVIHSKSK
jgi:PKD repeat protein